MRKLTLLPGVIWMGHDYGHAKSTSSLYQIRLSKSSKWKTQGVEYAQVLEVGQRFCCSQTSRGLNDLESSQNRAPCRLQVKDFWFWPPVAGHWGYTPTLERRCKLTEEEFHNLFWSLHQTSPKHHWWSLRSNHQSAREQIENHIRMHGAVSVPTRVCYQCSL